MNRKAVFLLNESIRIANWNALLTSCRSTAASASSPGQPSEQNVSTTATHQLHQRVDKSRPTNLQEIFGIHFLKFEKIFMRQATHTHTHTRLTALFPGLPRWAGTRKVTPSWIFVKQETVSGSSISWAVCKSAPHSRQITTPAPHHSDFYRPDAHPATQPTASKHWRQQ